MSVFLESYRLEAYLSGAWVDLSADVDGNILNIMSGIPGGQDVDLVARPGRMTFTLYNDIVGKYLPGHANARTGWNLDVKVRLILRYNGTDYTQFVGWVREIKPIFDGREQRRVNVTAYDWLEQAMRATITLPQIQRNKTAAQAVQAVLTKSPIQPESTNLATGSTFATVFDTVTGNTTVFGELAKIAQSEFGALYLRRDGTLVLESETSRDSGTPFFLSAPYGTEYAFLFLDDELFGLQDGDILQMVNINFVLINIFDRLEIVYGAHYINSGKVTGYPRRVDETPVILAKTPEALFIPANSSAIVTLPYVDPSGIARQVAGLSDEMEMPVPGNMVDSSLMTAVSFNLNANDLTGRHTWTLGETNMIQNDVYADGYGIVRVSGGPPGGGGYVVCGGYPNYKITTPASADFNFGSGAFTIGWWETRIDVTRACGSIAYGEDVVYPPFLLNYFIPATREMLIYMSSNGTSWDIANGRSFGKASASCWRHYELCRDANGWFYAFTDGKLTAKWYSPLAMGSGTNLCIGKTQGTYCYAGFADFYIHKKCLHTRDFEPPKMPKSLYLDEDYWGNTDKYRRGTDLAVSISPQYSTREVKVTLTNNSASDGYIYFQQRGKGVYFDAPLEIENRDDALIAIDGEHNVNVQQKYRTQPSFAKIAAIVTRRKVKRGDLLRVTITANLDTNTMQIGLNADIGTLLNIVYTPANINGYYWIQARELQLKGRQVFITWTLQQHFGSVI